MKRIKDGIFILKRILFIIIDRILPKRIFNILSLKKKRIIEASINIKKSISISIFLVLIFNPF